MFFDHTAVFYLPVKYSFPYILDGPDFYLASYFKTLGNLLFLYRLHSQPFCKRDLFTREDGKFLPLEKQRILNIVEGCKNQGY